MNIMSKLLFDMAKGIPTDEFSIETVRNDMGKLVTRYENDYMRLTIIVNSETKYSYTEVYKDIRNKISELIATEEFEEHTFFKFKPANLMIIHLQSKSRELVTKDVLIDILNDLATFMRAYL